MAYSSLLFDVTDGIGRITLNRPDKLNSFTAGMHAELREALGQLEPAGARVLVITGAGRGFCAGQDLGDRVAVAGQRQVDLGESVEKNYSALARSIITLPIPVVAAVNGVAAGAGANLALACDIVIAARSASFIQSFCKVGLVPDTGGTWILPRLVGTARALGLTLLGDRLSAEQAAAWGLIWRCVENAELTSVVDAVAVQLATGPTRGLAWTKRAIRGGGERSFEEALLVERDAQRELGASIDYAAGVAAFAAKQAPRFTGQ